MLENIRSVFTNGEEIAVTPTAPELSASTAFKVLSSRRRRLMIRYLAEETSGEFVELRDVVDAMTAWEYGSGYTSDERKRVYVSVWQHHLGWLEDSGAILRVDEHEIASGPSLPAMYAIVETAEDLCGGDGRDE